jgi:Fe-S cluster biosynthesis and repair protein YggX
MNKMHIIDFFSEAAEAQLKKYTSFVFLLDEPSIFIARHMRERLQKALSIDHLVSCRDDWQTDQSFFVESFFAPRTIWWKPYIFEGMTKKDSAMYELFFEKSTIDRIFFCTLSLEEAKSFDFSGYQHLLCITNEKKSSMNDLLLLQNLLSISASNEKLHTVLHCFSNETTSSLDALYAGLSFFSLIPARHLARVKESFLDQWILNRSLFELVEKLVALDKKAFFLYWDQLEETESPSFWISFWSDVFWKLYFFCEHFSAKSTYKSQFDKTSIEKKMYDVFTKKADHLKQKTVLLALERLYCMDDRIKNTGDEPLFDFLFLDFFLNNER